MRLLEDSPDLFCDERYGLTAEKQFPFAPLTPKSWRAKPRAIGVASSEGSTDRSAGFGVQLQVARFLQLPKTTTRHAPISAAISARLQAFRVRHRRMPPLIHLASMRLFTIRTTSAMRRPDACCR